MSVEKKFVAEGITKALVNEFLAEELERAGYGGMQMNRTPMGTQITVYAEKPGMVIGKGGKLIRKITRDLDRRFRLDNPQIDVQDVGRGDLNGRVVANRLASSLERGWYFRKAGQSMMRRVMDAGALGCEIVISGKLTGPRSRTEKFIAGYIKHSGKPAIELVDRGYSVAVKKLGVIGCQVRIIPPDVRLPDDFQIEAPPSVTEPAPPSVPAPSPAPAPAPVEEKKSELDQLLEPEPEAANVMPEPLEEQPLPQDTAEEASLIEEGDDSAPATRDE
ncbi:MAG TPA: 30S ribosomal protein S3 [Methanothrix sp.]|jgi:small subunit ribosomal protein S3|uniref:30S ribosomal protein S3 n=2 Tax=Methanothrix sp. TaxID=90426 RepID=UPI002CAA964A|nr:30S ribosomal protein S3 [Methanothrix sp.]MDI9416669.1 30S ribosomal protein S3 [Euryarchaeota archaeon]HON36018.1 30S ribosomal protein S3 [Methanothrix sp.]HRU75804.1 30S ribosomal protein S3 [Methanothrix sp.]